MILELHPGAVEEAQAANDRYFESDPSVAEAFMETLDRSFESILATPGRYPKYEHGTRRVVLRKFPFVIIYQQLAERVRVLAVAHTRREPGYWKSRQ